MMLRLGLAVLIFLMLQAVLFGVGAVLVLATPLKNEAMQLMPWVVGISALISAPTSWWFAPRLRARYWRTSRRTRAPLTACCPPCREAQRDNGFSPRSRAPGMI
jgi:hypothetical protein